VHGYDLPPEDHALLRTTPPPNALNWCGDVTRVIPLEGGTSSAVHEIELSDGTRLVLRRYVRTEWLEEEPDVAAREATALRLVTSLPAPRLVKLDPDGSQTGVPAVLMTRLAGEHDWRPDLEQLAALLPGIHALDPNGLPEYSPYPRETRTPPPWTKNPGLWQRAFALFDAAPPPHETTLIHRDFHPGNVLWLHGSPTGIVDWPNASAGAPQADIGHCRWNLATTQGLHAADRFLSATEHAHDYHPYWDVVAALGGQDPSHLTQDDEAFLVHALK
jgi:aminoglycoside phosphotransferase (APT) family kinase protein